MDGTDFRIKQWKAFSVAVQSRYRDKKAKLNLVSPSHSLLCLSAALIQSLSAVVAVYIWHMPHDSIATLIYFWIYIYYIYIRRGYLPTFTATALRLISIEIPPKALYFAYINFNLPIVDISEKRVVICGTIWDETPHVYNNASCVHSDSVYNTPFPLAMPVLCSFVVFEKLLCWYDACCVSVSWMWEMWTVVPSSSPAIEAAAGVGCFRMRYPPLCVSSVAPDLRRFRSEPPPILWHYPKKRYRQQY